MFDLAETGVDQISQIKASGWRLKLVVLSAGTILMGLEMAGSRILAIHFGSSVYVWGSIIGIFLGSLAGGYYIGGRAVDKRPSFHLLNLIVLLAGCWLVLLPFYDNLVARTIRSMNLGARIEPLLATLMLFGGPSILMGMVSPFAVRLSASGVEMIGNTAGRLYALSTVGSIVGTLVTAFWLIPAIGVQTIVRSFGVCLILVAFVGLPGSRQTAAIATGALLLTLASFGFAPTTFIVLGSDQRVVFEGDSAYHHIQIVDDQKVNSRLLRFNNFVESVISLTPPYESDSYTNSFQLARIFRPNLKRILFIGGGGGIGPRKFTSEDPNVVADLVEIDPAVVDLSRKYFFVVDSDRLRIHKADGRDFVRQTRDRYDLVILDAFTIGGQIPFHLTTREFMREIQRVLEPDGVVLENLNSALIGPKSRIFRSRYKTAATVFSNLYVFPRPLDVERKQSAELSASRPHNVILIAVNGAEKFTSEFIATRARLLADSGAVRTPTFLDDASRLYIEPVDTNDVPVLTDDYAPIDTMVF